MGYRAWLDQQAQRQDDNTYLIRPWGSRSGVYRIDAPTKDRWVRFRVASYWLTGIVTVLVFALNADRPWMSLYVISSAALAFTALLMARYGASRWILRHADRVPDERWKGSGVRWSVVPRRRYLWSVIWFGFLTALFAWSMLDETSGDAFRQYGPLVLLLSAWLLFSIFAYWRAGLEQKAYGDQQDGGSSIATVSTVVHTAKAGMGARRTLLAILIAPSATTLVAIIFWVIELLDGHSKFDPTSQGFKSNVETLLVILGTCYALSYTVGIPIYRLRGDEGGGHEVPIWPARC